MSTPSDALAVMARVRLTDAAKAQNMDHSLDHQVGTVHGMGDGWAEVSWPQFRSHHKIVDLELATDAI